MSKVAKTLERVLRGNADANIPFHELRTLLFQLGFAERIRGDHHIFTRNGVGEILNLQPRGSKAKAYQVKQVRAMIGAYKLAGETHAKAASKEPTSREKTEPGETEKKRGE